jgi:GrpB-like predicted nucleotidyltransferase (UPF0157 family)
LAALRVGRVDLYAADVVTVVDYDPEWPARFETLRHEYAAAMDAAGVACVAIEHVGSTSVSQLAAKPIIDCDIVVVEEDVSAATDVLIGLGFAPLGELGIPQRWAFKEPARLAGTNTYVTVEGSLSLRNHLAVREALRSSPDLRDRYAAVKQQIAATAADIDEYGKGKNALIQEILAVAGFTEAERVTIDTAQVPSHDEVPR